MLKELTMKAVGPGALFHARLAPRMNLLTGDNGLGKSFFLDVAWWAMTGNWSSEPAQPLPERKGAPAITAAFRSEKGANVRLATRYDFRKQKWLRPRQHLLSSSLIVYARIDGGFSVFDAIRRFPASDPPGEFHASESFSPLETSRALHLSKEQLWNGLEVGSEFPCEGLVRDWVRWQRESNGNSAGPFHTLQKVVDRLAPHPQEWIKIERPERVSVRDSRDIPVIKLPYGSTPVTLASEGMKRILGLAYVLVWAWHEHQQVARLARRSAAKELILLVDEIESHLHPLWQRTIVPAILSVGNELSKSLQLQYILTTHAPLVLASVEPLFKPDSDCLFLFEQERGNARLRQVGWVPQGDAVGWLTSEIFGLKQARSQQAERAIDAAEAFMRNETSTLPSGLKTKAQISKALRDSIPGHDPFWPRWMVKGEGLE